MVGEDLRVQALGQRSDLAQRSIPYEVERRRGEPPDQSMPRRPSAKAEVRPQPTTSWPSLKPLARFDRPPAATPAGSQADRPGPQAPSPRPLDDDWLAATIVVG